MHPSITHSTMVHMHPQQPRESGRRSGAYALVRLPSVPNQPKNKNKPIRVSEELWAAFGEVCKDEGTNRAADLRGYMERRVRRWTRLRAKRQGDADE